MEAVSVDDMSWSKKISFDAHCIIPLLLYYSPAISPVLQKQDFVVLRRLVSLISDLSFIPYSQLVTRIVERHMLSTSSFAERILDDTEHH